MSELQAYQPRAEVALATSQDVAVQRLSEWAQSADAAHRIAQTLVQTSFCPDSFRGKAGEATAAILAGLEMGLQPMASLRSFDVIQGQAAPRAITLRAVLQARGHEVVLVESTASRCVMRGRRAGSHEWQSVTWTIDRARQLGVTNKSNWKSQPQAMLVARATSELARLIASDAILGIGYSAEEIADGGSYDAQVQVDTTTPAPTSGTRKMSRGTRVTQVEPAPDPDPDAAPESPLLNTSSALAKRMFASINEAGIPEADRLTFCSGVIGREVTTSRELTDDDAHRIIEACQQPSPAEPADEPEPAEEYDPTAEAEWGAQ